MNMIESPIRVLPHDWLTDGDIGWDEGGQGASQEGGSGEWLTHDLNNMDEVSAMSN